MGPANNSAISPVTEATRPALPETFGRVRERGVLQIDDERAPMDIMRRFLDKIIPVAPFTMHWVGPEVTLEELTKQVVELLSLDCKTPPAAVFIDYNLSRIHPYTGANLLTALNEHFAQTKHRDVWNGVVTVLASAAAPSEIAEEELFHFTFSKTNFNPASITELLSAIEELLPPVNIRI